MENISSLLWMELNRLIGTAEQVYIRRRWSWLEQEKHRLFLLTRNSPCIFIDSGSRAEGLALPGSDVDFMYVDKVTSVLPSSSPRCRHADLIMVAEHVKPGFCFLRVMNNRAFVTTVVVDNFLSSLCFRDHNVQDAQMLSQSFVPHGPCSTDTTPSNMDRDFLVCIPCDFWPEKALKWKQRLRPNNWPPEELVKAIVSEGCLLVPIGNPNSASSHLEWRISFSLAEKRLVYSMNHTQILCYGLLKLFLKHVIESDEELKGLLCSYFLKTCLFYCIEEENIIWNKYNLSNCFWRCFFRLQTYVRQGYCPNYFIKDNNMFEGKISGQTQSKLLVQLSDLYENGIYTFGRIPGLSEFCNHVSGNSNPDMVITQVELEFLADVDAFGKRGITSPAPSDLHMLFILENCNMESPLDNTLLKNQIHQYNHLLVQTLYRQFMQSAQNNRKQYKRYKLLQRYVLHSCTGYDISTGLLQFASLCYNFGLYSTTIQVMEYLLRKFNQYTFYCGLGNSLVDAPFYISKFCGRGLTVAQKMKRATARTFVVYTDYCMYPSDIESEIRLHSHGIWTFVPPVVYTVVLLFLSYKAIGCSELIPKTLDDLYIVARGKRFITKLEQPVALALHDKCVQLNRD